jgi:aminomethyltransferase
LTTAFASWLACRGTEQVELAPGISTPRSFGDARREHLATRRAGGLFDFSFMGGTAIGGPDALACVNALQTRCLDTLRPGRMAYTLLLHDDGSVLNDATVWCLDRDLFWVFTGRRADYTYIVRCSAHFDIEIADRSESHAVIAVQGEVSRRAIEQCFPGAGLAALPYYGFQRALFGDTECWIARLGYSGETGYELVVASAAASVLWQARLAQGADAGLLECGFDAIDSLRIESGHILFARELASPVTPLELGLARFVDFDRQEFCGRQALRAQRSQEPRCRLAGLLPALGAEAELSLPKQLADGSAVMTSACWSPLLERCLGIGFVTARDAYPGTTVRLSSGARAQVARLPFYDPAKLLPRRAR